MANTKRCHHGCNVNLNWYCFALFVSQLADLQFYVKTQRQVNKSSIKDDIQGGQMFVSGNEQTVNSTPDDKKKAKKKRR